MAITTRVPDPTNEYEVANQRQIVRSINNIVQQINAQYKPQGEIFSEIEQLSYFLGNAPAKPSGPESATVGGGGSGGTGLPYSRVGQLDFFLGGSFGALTATANRGYLVTELGYFPDGPYRINLPVEPAVGTKVAITNGSGYNLVVDPGQDSLGYDIKIDGYSDVTIDGYPPLVGRSRTYVYFGDGGYPAGATPGYGYNYFNTWYSIAIGYN
tara:strand:+ start:33 stop:668 length:636 start_codon:yes stop_codon:yes gene_type:complete